MNAETMNDLAALARVTRSAKYRRAIADAVNYIDETRAELANARAHEQGLIEEIASLRAKLATAAEPIVWHCDDCHKEGQDSRDFAARNLCMACARKLPVDPDADLYEVAAAMEEAYSVADLRAMGKALDTAMDDSHHFAKDSDDDGEERAEESRALSKLAHLIAFALEGTEEADQ